MINTNPSLKENQARTSASYQQVLSFFPHRFDFIYAENPKKRKGKPDWKTANERHYLRSKCLIERYFDENQLLGVSFGKETKYLVVDLDRGSAYHPSNSWKKYKELEAALEEIGLIDSVKVRSSYTEGLHLYFFWEKETNSFNLAAAAKLVLEKHGIKLKSGQVEIFPNPKGYNKRFRAHRLPLQPETGSCLVDDDFNPISDKLEVFFKQAEQSAKRQDWKLLKKASVYYGKAIRARRARRNSTSLAKFRKDLETEFSAFTGKGETNEILLALGCYGVVFERLDQDVSELADFMEKKVTALNGYKEFCDHHHEIAKRCREVARSSQEYYWAVDSEPKRAIKRFKDAFGNFLDETVNGCKAVQLKTLQRLKKVVEWATEARLTIANKSEFLDCLIAKSKEIFGVGFSKSTLRKTAYKEIWLPVFEILNSASEITSNDHISRMYTLQTNNENPETLKPLKNKVCTHLSLYEGLSSSFPNSDNFQPIAEKEKKAKNSSSEQTSDRPLAEQLNSDQQNQGDRHEKLQADKSQPQIQPNSDQQVANRLNHQKKEIRREKSQNKSFPVTKQQKAEAEQIARQRREEKYYKELQMRHTKIRQFEEERQQETYKNIARKAFEQCRAILNRNRHSAQGDSS